MECAGVRTAATADESGRLLLIAGPGERRYKRAKTLELKPDTKGATATVAVPGGKVRRNVLSGTDSQYAAFGRVPQRNEGKGR